jgi:hypothetical protein
VTMRGQPNLRFWARSVILAVALGGVGLGGFAALEHLDEAMAAPATVGAVLPDGGVPIPPPLPAKVKIYFFTVPDKIKTELRWGKRKLGIINPAVPPKLRKPFFIERPRDSGPMDVLAKAEGFLPLNTRVYTYADNKIWLKLTAEADKAKVLGYKQEIPDGGVDGGQVVPMMGYADGGVPMPAPVGPMLPPAPMGPTLPPGPPPVAPAPQP